MARPEDDQPSSGDIADAIKARNDAAAKQAKDAQKAQQQQQKKKDDSGGWGVGDIVNAIPVVGPASHLLKGDIAGAAETAFPGAGALQEAEKGAWQGGAALLGHSTSTDPTQLAQQGAAKGVAEGWDQTLGRIPGMNAVTRWGSAGLQAPLQALQGQVRGAAGEVSDKGLGALNPFGDQTKQEKQYLATDPRVGNTGLSPALEQTTAGQAIRREAQGKDSGLGQGFVASQNAPAGKEQAKAARQYSPYLINGSAWTPGRALAQNITPKGSTAFNIMSGAIDAGLAVATDPTNLLLTGVSQGVRGAKEVEAADQATVVGNQLDKAPQFVQKLTDASTAEQVKLLVPELSTTTAERVANASSRDVVTGILKTEAGVPESVGVLQNAGAYAGLRTGVHGQSALEWMGRPEWAGLEDKLIAAGENPETELSQFRRILNKAPMEGENGASLYDTLRTAVHSSEDPNEVRSAIKEAMFPQLGITPGLKTMPGQGLGYAYRRFAQSNRLLGLMPDRIANPANPDEFVETLDRTGQLAKLSMPERDQIITDWMANPSREQSAQAAESVMDLAKRSMVKAGINPDRADDMTRLWAKEQDMVRQYAINHMSDSSGVYREGMVTADGPINYADHIHDINQMLNSTVIFPDPRELRRDVSFFQPILNNQAIRVTDTALTSFMNFWRPARIMRLGLPLRVIADAQFLASAHGLAGAFNHPIQNIAWTMAQPTDRIDGLINRIFGHAPTEAPSVGIGEQVPPGGIVDRAQQAGTEVSSATGREAPTLGEASKGAQAPGVGVAGEAAGESAPAASQLLRRLEAGTQENIPGTPLDMPSVLQGRGFSDPQGAPFDRGAEDAYGSWMRQNWSRINGPAQPKLEAREFIKVPSDHPAAARGVVEELQARSNSVMDHALIDSPDQGNEWFWSGGGQATREELSKLDHFAPMATDRNFSDAYMQGMRDDAKDMTGGSDELFAALKDQKLNGQPLLTNGEANPDAVSAVQDILDRGEGPKFVPVRNNIMKRPTDLEEGKERLDRVAREAFSWVLPRPEAFFARSPIMRQLVWKNAEDAYPYLQDADRATFLGNAEQANLGEKTLTRLKNIPSALNGADDPRSLNLEQLTHIAGANAAHDAPDILHNLSDRGAMWDAMRNVVPFGDAWSKVAQRYGTLAMERPQTFERAMWAVNGAEAAGFVREDPQTGQQTFVIPGSEWLMNKTAGAPIPLQAPISGLSILSEGFPGIGPAAQLPLSTVLKDTPQWDSVKKILYPYGQPADVGNPKDNIFEAINPLPSFLNRINAAFSDPAKSREYGNTVGWAQRYLLSTGQYTTATPAEMDRLYKDAKTMAQRIELTRGVVQAVSPAAPFPEYKVKDKNGKLVDGSKLVNEWQKLQTTKGLSYDDAYGTFIAKHGQNNMLITQAFSEPTHGFLPLTDEAETWLKSNPDVASRYPDVFGLFAPSKGNFSLDAWQSQLDRGERKSIDPQQLTRLANNRQAAYVYRQERQASQGPNGQIRNTARSYLDHFKDYLAQIYPGYEPSKFDVGKNPMLIQQLDAATKDPTVKSSSPGIVQAVRSYLDQRQQLMDSSGLLSLQGKQAANDREALKSYADELARKYRGFGRVFDSVFSSEVR